MSVQVEVCIDSLESLHAAIKGGANRIELCSSLDLGGLTPSFGLMKKAAQLSPIPVYAMIRPRQGDFCYDNHDIESMLLDIEAAASVGLQGVVFGVLTPEGLIDLPVATKLMQQAKRFGLGVTFHRAIDLAAEPLGALETIIELGCERILTSGLKAKAIQGIETIGAMVEQANGRISIMPGAGVNLDNVLEIVTSTGVKEVHMSGKSTRPSVMKTVDSHVKMGASDIDEFQVPVTNATAVSEVIAKLKTLT